MVRWMGIIQGISDIWLRVPGGPPFAGNPHAQFDYACPAPNGAFGNHPVHFGHHLCLGVTAQIDDEAWLAARVR